MFPEKIVHAVFALRAIYKGRKYCVTMNYPIIEIIKHYKDREMSLKLFYYSSSNTFEIQPPDSKFFSKISFFDFSKPERHWIRNKDFLFMLINDLKRCDLWEFVSNKDFLIVNQYNTKVRKDTRIKMLKNIILD